MKKEIPQAPRTAKYCTECGSLLNAGAHFCHSCGWSVDGGGGAGGPSANAAGLSPALKWGVPSVAVAALLILSVTQMGSRSPAPDERVPLTGGGGGTGIVQAMDISSLSPEERADRLFNRVMRLNTEGKADSAAFFGPMAVGALEALVPLDLHRRYDLGLIQLVTGDQRSASAQADTILKSRPTHLLGLSLAARAADARSDAAAAAGFRQRLLAAEPAERAVTLPEYTDHAPDVRAAIDLAKKR